MCTVHIIIHENLTQKPLVHNFIQLTLVDCIGYELASFSND